MRILYLYLSIILLISACTYEQKYEGNVHLSAENQDLPSNYSFDLGQSSEEKTRKGKASIRLDDEHPYGLTLTIPAPFPAAKIKASVWRNINASGTGALVLSGGDQLYKMVTTASKEKDGWEKLELEVLMPYKPSFEELKVYAWNPGTGTAYFDDLKFEFIEEESVVAAAKKTSKHLSLNYDATAEDHIYQVRKRAFDRGFLMVEDNDWVEGFLTEGEDTIPCEARLKGDWPDHLKGKKWSFRVKTDSKKFWNRMRTFSIQSPTTRNYLNEWLWHKVLLDEDVLATRYDFVNFSLNGDDRGIFAIEEHFEKQLVEHSKRREGPIVKFNEDGFWEMMYRDRSNTTQTMGRVPFYEASTVDVFKKKKTLKSDNLKGQFALAQNLMHQYQEGSIAFSEIFDVDQMAKFLVLTDLFSAYHTTRWHNMRFYYNPVTARLEPIGFDGFGEEVMKISSSFLGYRRHFEAGAKQGEAVLLDHFFKDPEFFKRYNFYLQKYCNSEFVEAFFNKYAWELDKWESELQAEFKEYKFDRERILKRARTIDNLAHLFKETSIKAYHESGSESKMTLRLENFHCLPVELVGVGTDRERITTMFVDPILLPAYKRGMQTKRELEVKGAGDYLFARVAGWEEVEAIKIIPYGAPKNEHPRQALFASSDWKTRNFLQVDEVQKEIRFRAGKHVVETDLIIPANYRLIIGEGVEIDLINGSKIISNSAVDIRGSQQEPVFIHSSDKSSQGFTVLQAKEDSHLKNVLFEGLKNLNHESWTLTGAVNFYESDLVAENVSFVDNDCEDGLNVIRSKIDIRKARFSKTGADAFDCDFCTGKMQDSDFENTGNDALDLSGSNLDLHDLRFKDIGDKAISVGEESNVRVNAITVENAPTAFAAKDLSKLVVMSADISRCGRAFYAYQKKPEFGPATIIVKEHTATDVQRLWESDRFSSIDFGATCQLSDHDNNVEAKGILFLGHTYSATGNGNKVDPRLLELNLNQFENIWLGGDVCSETTKEEQTLDCLDDLFDLGNRGNHWSLGNHDVRNGHIDWIESRTRRPSFYAENNGKFTLLNLNTNLKKGDCQIASPQFEMIQNVCDTINKSSQLIVLTHHAIWSGLGAHIRSNAKPNAAAGWMKMECTETGTFENSVYPLLKKVQAKGIQVICLAGDFGQKSKAFDYTNEDGITFLGAGLNESSEARGQDKGAAGQADQVIIFNYDQTGRALEWEFVELNKLLGQ